MAYELIREVSSPPFINHFQRLIADSILEAACGRPINLKKKKQNNIPQCGPRAASSFRYFIGDICAFPRVF